MTDELKEFISNWEVPDKIKALKGEDNGEVSWIKLKVGMFDDSKIKYIEALPERDTIITIWVKLLTLSGKYNEQGYIMLSENLPYNEEMLANEFSRPINSIRLAIQTFETLGMIEKLMVS